MLRLSLLPAACCLLPALARAQDDRPSHVPVPRASDADPTQLFRERIQQSKSRSELDALLKQFGAGGAFRDPEQMRRLLEDNPQLRDMARKMAQDLSNGDPETQERLRGLIGSVLQSNPELANRYGLTPKMIEEQLRDASRSRPGPSTFSPDRRPRPERPPPRPADRPPTPPRSETAEADRRRWASRLAEWSDKLSRDGMSGPLRDSPAIRDLVRELSDSAANALRSSGSADGLDTQLAAMEERWRAARDWLPQELPESLRSMNWPDVSNVPRPNWHVPTMEVSPPAFSAPRFSASGVDLGTAANVLLAVIGVVVVAAVVWRLRGGSLAADAAGRRPLGPWPLDPSRVATREELIRAFEHLTLLRCGEPARAWHHRAIAAYLGGPEAERRDAAERLAQLYEQARYAPAALSEPDWTAARGPLTLLAGVG
jgi:hypothetical protein